MKMKGIYFTVFISLIFSIYSGHLFSENKASQEKVLNTCYTLFGGHSKFLDCISSFIPGIFIEYF